MFVLTRQAHSEEADVQAEFCEKAVPEEKDKAGSVRAVFRSISARLTDGASPIFYFTIVLIAMAGWIYFIGRLLWQFTIWMFS